jgi:methylenetetrahydrofolate reductase (NADPH)
MLIRDMLGKGRVTVSCELFPPKRTGTCRSGGVVRKRRRSSDFISVTYGASGGTSQKTLAWRHMSSVRGGALAHLTCVSSTREKLARLSTSYMSVVSATCWAAGDNGGGGASRRRSSTRMPASWYARYVRAAISHGGASTPTGIHKALPGEVIRHLKEKWTRAAIFNHELFFDNNVLTASVSYP